MFRLGVTGLCVLLLGFLTLSSLVAAKPAPWPVYGQNLRHSSESPHPAPLTPHILWTFSTGGAIESNPIIGPDGMVYVGSSDHRLYALSPEGSLLWSFTAEGPVMTPALLPDGGLVAGSLDDHLYALDPNGALRWKVATGGNIEGAPVVAPDGAVYIGSGDGSLYRIQPDGVVRWRYETSAPIYGSPALFKHLVIVGSFDKKLHAVDSESGKAVWTLETRDSSPYGIYASPALDETGLVYVGNVDRRFYAVNPDGSLRWEKTFGSPIITSAIPLTDGVILATGKALVRHAEPKPPDTAATVVPSPPKKKAKSKTNIPESQPDSSSTPPASRSLDWIFLAPDTLGSSPALSQNGLVLVGCDDGHLYALNLADGTMRWTIKLDGRVASSPSIGADGRIYVGTDAGTLTAIGDAPPGPTEKQEP